MTGIVLLLLLAALHLDSARRTLRGWPERVCAAFLLLWGNLVAGGLLASLPRRLNDRFVYSAALVVTAAIITLLVRRGARPAPVCPVEPETKLRFSPLLGAALLTALVAAAATIVLVVFYEPNNPDSLAYRLPRPFLYFAQGTVLRHPSTEIDPRLLFYPLNTVLFHVFGVCFAFAPLWFHGLSLLSWLVAGTGVAALAREIGASRPAALFAAAVFLTTPAVLTLGASTNDEIAAAAPLLAAVLFARVWWRRPHPLPAMLAGLGLGLSLGAKVHVVFFAPYVLLVGAVFLWRRRRSLAEELRPGLRHVAAAFLLALALGTPHLLVNRLQTGQWVLRAEMMNDLRNRPFRLDRGLSHLALQSGHLFLGAPADLYPGADMAARQRWYEACNRALTPAVLLHLGRRPGVHVPANPYRGVILADGWVLNENTVWLGFVPFALLLAPLAATGSMRRPALFLLGGFWAWHLTYCLLLRYGWWIGLYYAFPFTLAAAGLAVLWERRMERGRRGARVLAVLLGGLVLSNALFTLNILRLNNSRNLGRLVRSGFAVQRRTLPADLPPLLRRSPRVHLVYTEWELPLFEFMKDQPRTLFTCGRGLRADTLDLVVVPPRLFPGGYLPLAVNGGRGDALTFLGTLSTWNGEEMVFAHGGAARRAVSAAWTRFVVLRLEGDDTLGDGRFRAIGLTPFAGFTAADWRVRLAGAGAPPTEWRSLDAACRLQWPAAGPAQVELAVGDPPRIVGAASLDGDRGQVIVPREVVRPAAGAGGEI